MNKRRLFVLPLMVLCLAVFAGTWHPHLLFWKKKKKAEVAADTVAKKTEYEKLFNKKHKIAKGLITLHQMDGKLYFELPVSLFGKDMLIGSTVTNVSDNGNAIVGAKPTAPLLVKFTRNKTNVQLREVSTEYVASESSMDSALVKSYSDVILANPKIAAWTKDSTAVVFDMTNFFVGDNKKMPPFDENSVYGSYQRTQNYKSENSYLVDVKAFSDNVSIKSCLSYEFSVSAQGKSIVKERPFTAEMTRSIMLLKEKPYRPRMADYRIGYFFTEREQLNPSPATSKPIYFTNRWDLQPKDSAAYMRGETVDVVKPIVFYVDNTFPEKWRPYIKEAVNMWAQVFEEECRLRGAVVAKDFPTNDLEFDPDNIKYNCIRYAPISIKNAMGPSWVDPRSGEILMASVYVYHDFIKLVNNWLFVQTAAADKAVRTNEMPEAIMGDAIRYVLGHEVGHCLGLMHNMGASNNVPVEKLRDPVYTHKYGTTPSIMDYARFNYVAQPGDKERGVKMTPPRFGVYDRYAIKWGYTPIFDKTLKEEEAYMTQWITDSLKKSPLYRYGKQQFGTPFGDPRSMNEDLGDDAVKATKYGVKNLKYIMANMDTWLKDKDSDMSYRSSLIDDIIQQYALYAVHVASNVGGYYLNEVKDGDGQVRLRGLDKARQKEALNYLFTLYSDLDWMDNKTLLSKIALSGSPKLTIQNYVRGLILSAPVVVSCYNSIDKTSLQPDEALDMVYRFVWKPTMSGKKLLDSEMSLQKAYVVNMINNSGLTLPKSLANQALVGESANFSIHFDKICHCEEMPSIAIPSVSDKSLNPIGGFEQVPREMFSSTPSLTPADMYAYLQKVRRLLLAHRNVGTSKDRAHYEYLLRIIDNSIK